MQVDTYALKKNTIMEVYSIKDAIDLEPSYQRNGGLWDGEKKQEFLDSIFNGYDVPKLYFHILNTPKKVSGKLITHAIIDGRQRLETIWEFIDGKTTLGSYVITRLKEPANLDKIKYEELATKYLSLKTFFDKYELPIMLVKLEDEKRKDLINEMFLRLNSGVTLTAAEKRNAIGGKMAKTIRNLTSHEFFNNCVSLTNKRYQHYEVSVRLLFLENSIQRDRVIDTKKKYLDGFVRDYRKELPKDDSISMVESVLETMTRIFTSKDKLLNKQARIPIYYLLTREAKQQNKIRYVTHDAIKSFNEQVDENKKLVKAGRTPKDQTLAEYDRSNIQGTNDAGSIKRRFKIISKYLGIDSSEIINLQSTRE